MDDLISRQDTIDAIIERADEQLEWTLIGSQYTRSAASVVMAMPAADIPSIQRGYWKPITWSEATGYDPTLTGCDPIYSYICSVCGADNYIGEDGHALLTPYCPCCGSRMEDVEE